MIYEDLTTEQRMALSDAIRNLPNGWRELDEELLALLLGGIIGADTEPDPAPGPDPDPDPAPGPDPAPDPAPDPDPDPAPGPDPAPDPAPGPDPAPDPAPDPDPDPAPGPDPAPDPAPGPDPAPDPAPGPDPAPDPDPAPGPDPDPAPGPDPDPAPGPDPDPAPGPDPDPAPGPDPDPAPAPDPDPDPVPAPDPTPQGEFQFSVPVSGWGAESYLVHWGDESVEIAQSRGNRATLADIETALESMRGIRDVEVTAPGPAEIIEGTGGRPYRVEVLDADPDTFRVTKGNGKVASVRKVEAQPDPATGSDTVAVNGQPGQSFDAGEPGVAILSIRDNSEQGYTSNYRLTWPENEGGTYRFDFAGDLTAPLLLSATESQLEAALWGLDGIISVDVEGQLRAWEIEITATESETLELVDDGLVLGYVDLGLIA